MNKNQKEPKVDFVLNENNLNKASILKRIIAFILDLIIIQILLSPLSVLIENKFQFGNDFNQNFNLLYNNPNILSDLMFITFLIFLIIFFYFVYFEYKLGKTPGKLILGLKVINEKSNNLLKKTEENSEIEEKQKEYKNITENITDKNIKEISKKENSINIFQSILRNLFLIPLFPFYLLWIIDPVYLLMTKKRLSEKYSKTLLIEEKKTFDGNELLNILKSLAMIFFVILGISFLMPFFETDINYGKNIAIIPMYGVISVSEGDMFSSDVISSDAVIKKIEKAENNKEIKAIIFDINSPGGSPVATDEISQKIKSLKQKNITTISVIREYGASGAYWIASSTDYIFANRMSLVGSIGVIGSYLDFSGLLNRYNITYQRYVSGNLKDMGSPFKQASEEEKIVFQKMINDLNEIFINEVSENRNLSVDYVRELATGQVYLGIEAKELGLIDEIGSKQDAIKLIEKKTNISANIIEYKESKSIFDNFLNAISNIKIGTFINQMPLIK
ncbi:MAG: signal peptide peptidase SppA [Candidatus Woesearchaeota archaeon]